MSNWFQEHPVFTIVSHTIVVATLTWAGSSFIIDENKVNLYKAKAENAESMSAQYNAKISVLEFELGKLKVENERYLSWLTSDPKSMPAMEKRIKTLEESLASMSSKGAPAGASEDGGKEKAPSLYEFSSPFLKGESFVDPKTKATIGVSDITPHYTATGVLHLPGGEVIDLNEVKPGTTWSFEKGGVKYQMTLESVNWINNSLKASVTEVK